MTAEVAPTVVVASAAAPYAGRRFSEFAIGQRFGMRTTIGPEHLVEAARLTGDTNPLHVDRDFALRSRYGDCILHGVATSAILSAPFGNLVAGTAIAYLEHSSRFTGPVRAGDTLEIVWRVIAVSPKPQHGGGIVTAECEARNQRGEVVATASGKMLVSDQLAA